MGAVDMVLLSEADPGEKQVSVAELRAKVRQVL